MAQKIIIACVLLFTFFSCDRSNCDFDEDRITYISLPPNSLNWFDSVETNTLYDLYSSDSLTDRYKIFTDTNASYLQRAEYECYEEITLGQNYEISYYNAYVNPDIKIRFGFYDSEYTEEFQFCTNYWTQDQDYSPSRIELSLSKPYKAYSYDGWNTYNYIQCDTCFEEVGQLTVKGKTFEQVFKITDLQAMMHGADYTNTVYWVDRHYGLIKAKAKNGRTWFLSL